MHVEILLFDGFDELDALGPWEVFAGVAAVRDDVTASLGYEMDNGFSVEVWARNLLNDRNIETIFDSVAQPKAVSGYPNDPRTYGVTARFKW